jgi:hypothetical protein
LSDRSGAKAMAPARSESRAMYSPEITSGSGPSRGHRSWTAKTNVHVAT